MDFLTAMSPVQAAAMNIGLLILMMLGLKLYVGAQRGKLKLPSGETNPEFNRATRVQLNAVEDVPVLMVGIAGLAIPSTSNLGGAVTYFSSDPRADMGITVNGTLGSENARRIFARSSAKALACSGGALPNIWAAPLGLKL